jgi:hypothetical protein
MDDPAFLPETALPALDFDFSNLELEPFRASERSTQSMMSIHGRSRSLSSSHIVGILDLPSSSTHAGPQQLPLDDPFTGSSLQKPLGGTGRGLFDDENDLFQDDLIFEFDADGQIRDIDASEREARRAGSIYPKGLPGSDSAASRRVRKEHEEAAGHILPVMDAEGDFDMMNFGEDMQMLPEAEPFPMMSGGLGANDRPQPLIASEDRVYHVSSQENSSETAEAPLRHRKPKVRKTLGLDQTVELRNSDLLQWQREYSVNMTSATLLSAHRRATAHAKKNAFSFVYGAGLNRVGHGIGTSKVPLPLDMFSGASLLAKLTGQAPLPTESQTKSSKRTRDAHEEEQQQVTPKRARHAEGEDEIGRGSFDDDQAMLLMEEDPSLGMEIGRDAPSALTDYPSSAMMPWNVNISASLPSHPGRTSSRLASRSPLIGRGSNIPGPLGHFSLLEDDHNHHQITYGRSDDPIINNNNNNDDENDDDDAILRRHAHPLLNSSSSHPDLSFEIFGPSANVDTQTAANSQWVREALDREALNFLEYVRHSIMTTADDVQSVTFEQLFEPRRNSRIVAAQAFYHVLSLATKGRVWVTQGLEGEGEEGGVWGEIRMGILG